ncbi:hypothetical protein [Streptomyces venezuelae]|uniref:hypothetical protein n=1 Tax=Streptomyces venezuelae TaxID=54571 RepID=UPI003787E3BF
MIVVIALIVAIVVMRRNCRDHQVRAGHCSATGRADLGLASHRFGEGLEDGLSDPSCGLRNEGVERCPCLGRPRPQFFAVRCTVKSTDHADGLLGPCVQVTIGYEQTELVNGLEGLAPDSEGLGSRCHVRRAVPLLVLPVPPVVLAPYELVGRGGEGEDGTAAFAPVCHTFLEAIPHKGTEERSRHCDEGRKYLAHQPS